MSEETQVNRDIRVNETVLNRELEANATVLNRLSMLYDPPGAEARPEGHLLCGKYQVVRQLDVMTGEADLYLCIYADREYIAKIYRRKSAIKPEVYTKLKEIRSPYVSRVYDIGEQDGYPVVIMAYYRSGSLQGKRFSFERLKNHIIPSLNEGLKVLHDSDIIHKDLKPSNIMLADNQRDVTIVDFGISSIREDGSTVVVTQTGMTPEYSAPETFRSLYLVESDYYSLGITIFELYCGYTPYHNMAAEEIEQYVSVQRIPFPADMPPELQDFISAVTYSDITNRKNKLNPNRRWCYEEVKNWCEGVVQTIPGEGMGGISGDIRPYTFLGQSYTDRAQLVYALAENWNDGKKQLFRGLLSAFFKTFDPEIAGYCLDAEEEVTITYGKENLIFWHLLYKLNPGTREFYWHGKVYGDLPALGRELLEALWDESNDNYIHYSTILDEEMLSAYVMLMEPENRELLTAVQGLETTHRAIGGKKREKVQNLYLMAYMLSGQKILRVDGRDIKTAEELLAYMKELLAEAYEMFEAFCHKMIDGEQLDAQLAGWLIAIGKRKELAQWQERMKVLPH